MAESEETLSEEMRRGYLARGDCEGGWCHGEQCDDSAAEKSHGKEVESQVLPAVHSSQGQQDTGGRSHMRWVREENVHRYTIKHEYVHSASSH